MGLPGGPQGHLLAGAEMVGMWTACDLPLAFSNRSDTHHVGLFRYSCVTVCGAANGK
jgi:hypothetical protein